MSKRRTTWITAVACALTLSACGRTAQQAGQPAVAQGGAEFGQAGDKSKTFGTDAKPGEFPRTIRPGYPWKENFRLDASALDRVADARRMLTDYAKHAEDVGDTVEAKSGKRPTISMVRFLAGKTRLYTGKSFIGTILVDAKLPQPESRQVDDLAVEVSTEQIGEVDADRIPYSGCGDVSKTARAAILGGPLRAGLTAVKAGHAKPVADETWFLGLGVIGAEAVLTDLEKQLIGLRAGSPVREPRTGRAFSGRRAAW